MYVLLKRPKRTNSYFKKIISLSDTAIVIFAPEGTGLQHSIVVSNYAYSSLAFYFDYEGMFGICCLCVTNTF